MSSNIWDAHLKAITEWGSYPDRGRKKMSLDQRWFTQKYALKICGADTGRLLQEITHLRVREERAPYTVLKSVAYRKKVVSRPTFQKKEIGFAMKKIYNAVELFWPPFD